MNRSLIVVGGVVILGVVGALAYNASRSPEAAPETAPKEVQVSDEEQPVREPTSNEASETGNMEVTYAHVAPNEYSEIYAVVTGLTPGVVVDANLQQVTQNGTKNEYSIIATETAVADENGVAQFTFQITSYGKYQVNEQHLHSNGTTKLGQHESITVK